jgi:ParB family transcriptional regulator, chromosome partitioning protein
VERLLHHAGDRWFDHTLGQLREERASAQAQAEAAQQFRERGFTVLAEQPASYDEDRIPLRYLVTADGGEAGEAAVTDPAHWAVLLVEDTVFVDAETGELVDETTIDWNTEDAPDAEPAEGMRHANTVKEAEAFVPEYYCTDYRAAGLTPEKFFARRAGIVDVDTDSADEEPADQEARDAQRETARLKAEADKEEAEKRERRKVLALNKLGLAAEGVRREFVKTLLQRKTPPKGAAIFVADCLARDSYLLTTNNANATTAELLGVDHRPDVVSKLAGELSANSGDGRAQVLTLALVLGALEAKTPKDSWRNPAGAGYWGHRVTSADYLRWLAENGYTLAPIEEVVTGAKKADKVFSQYLADATS